MVIEFNTVYGQVPEKLINEARKKIMPVIHIDKKIRRAEVTLKEEKLFFTTENKSCCIKLIEKGENIVIHTRRQDFKSAIEEAIKELKKRVKRQAIRKFDTMVA